MPLPAFEPGSVLTYITSKGWDYKRSGDQLVLQVCPFCQRTDWRFYISETSGLYICQHASCDSRGSLYWLQKKMGDAPNVPSIRHEAQQQQKAPQQTWGLDAIAPFETALEASARGQAFLKERGITPDTAKAWHLGVKHDKGSECLTIPWMIDDTTVTGMKYRSLPPDEKKYWRKAGAESILYGEHLISSAESADTLYLAEGELDAITLWQHGFRPVLSTTAGAGTFKPRWYDLIVSLRPKNIVVCYDNDVAGVNGAEAIKKKFDDHVVKIIQLPEGIKDVNDFFLTRGPEEFQSLVTASDEPPMEEAKHISEVFDELETRMFLGGEAFNGLSSIWPELNGMIGGGYWNGFLCTLSGPSGTGKTTMALQEMWRQATLGNPAYMLCLEMPNTMMLQKLIEHVYHIPILKQTLSDVKMARKQMEKHGFYIGQQCKSPEDLDRIVRKAVKRYDLKMLCFDNINFFVRSVQHTTQEIGIVTKKLKDLAVELDIPIVMIAQPRKFDSDDRAMRGDDLKDSAAIQQDSDIIMLLHRRRNATKAKDFGRQPAQAGNMSPYTLLRVDKARYSAGGEMYLYLDGATSTYRELTSQEREKLHQGNE